MKYKVKFSYEDTVSEELILETLETPKRLLNRLLKANSDVSNIDLTPITQEVDK
jgi:hypothetical protein